MSNEERPDDSRATVVFDDLSGLPALDRAIEADRRRSAANAEQAHWAKVRAEAAGEMRADGMTLEEVGEALGGISPQAVSKLLRPARGLDADLFDAGCRLLLDYADLGAGALRQVQDALRTPPSSLPMKAKRFALAAKHAQIELGDMTAEQRLLLRDAMARAVDIAYPVGASQGNEKKVRE
jgi:hypothetical protein